MTKIIRITESNLKTIINHIVKEQLELSKMNPISWVKSNIDKVQKFFEAKDIVENTGKRIYNSGSLEVKSYPYRAMKDKEDAFCHQAMSAYSTSLFGENISSIIGYLNEVKGGVRIFFKGTSKVPRFTKISSGYETDVKNNEIGRQIAVQNPNKTLNEYLKLIENNINSKNYYNTKSQYVKNLK
jgi:hypothetical protein